MSNGHQKMGNSAAVLFREAARSGVRRERPSSCQTPVVDAARACPGRARSRMGARYRGEGGTPGVPKAMFPEKKNRKPIRPPQSAQTRSLLTRWKARVTTIFPGFGNVDRQLFRVTAQKGHGTASTQEKKSGVDL